MACKNTLWFASCRLVKGLAERDVSHVRACTRSHSSARSVPSWPAVREIPDPLMMHFFCGGHLNPFPSVITTPTPAMALSIKTTLREFRRSLSLPSSYPALSFLCRFFCLSLSLAAHFPMQRDVCSVWRLFFPELHVKLEHSSALCVARGSLSNRYTLDSHKIHMKLFQFCLRVQKALELISELTNRGLIILYLFRIPELFISWLGILWLIINCLRIPELFIWSFRMLELFIKSILK